MAERPGAPKNSQAGHVHRDEDEVCLGDVADRRLLLLLATTSSSSTAPEAGPEAAKDECNEDVETLTNALKHDEVEWNADEGVEHTEDLATHCLRGAVTIP